MADMVAEQFISSGEFRKAADRSIVQKVRQTILIMYCWHGPSWSSATRRQRGSAPQTCLNA